VSLSALLVDSSGICKYDIIATSPGPILLADLEGGSHKLPRPVTHWDGKGPLPSLNEESIVVIIPEKIRDLEEIVKTLHSPTMPFKSFWLDSATVLTQLGEVEIVKMNRDGRQGYGDMLRLLQPMFTGLKQIAARPSLKLEVVGFTAWLEQNKQAPALQGSISTWFLNMCDVVGYPTIEVVDKRLASRMRIAPAPNGVDPKAKGTKAMIIKFGEDILNPNFTELNKEYSA
jgi:hypothetical protein